MGGFLYDFLMGGIRRVDSYGGSNSVGLVLWPLAFGGGRGPWESLSLIKFGVFL